MTEPTREELLAQIEQLEQDLWLHKAMYEQSSVSLQIYALSGKFISVNKTWQDMWQLSDEDLKIVFEQYNVLTEPQLIEAGITPSIERAFREGESTRLPPFKFEPEKAVPDASARMRWVAAEFYPLRDAEGTIQAIGVINYDVTELKEEQTQLEAAKAEQAAIIEAQQAAIQELSTPIIPIVERVIVMPLVGSITDARARDILRDLLRGITQHRAKIVILDITGVNSVDSEVIGHLDKSIQAARLKGAQTIVTGVSDAVAEAIIDLGIDWSTIETVNDLAGGLRLAISRVAA